jgi:hypothetical protein
MDNLLAVSRLSRGKTAPNARFEIQAGRTHDAIVQACQAAARFSMVHTKVAVSRREETDALRRRPRAEAISSRVLATRKAIPNSFW